MKRASNEVINVITLFVNLIKSIHLKKIQSHRIVEFLSEIQSQVMKSNS